MKIKILLFMVLAAAFAPQALAQARDAATLTQMLHEFLAGAGRNDAQVHDRFWADDLIYTRGTGERVGKAEIMQGVRSAPQRKESDPVTTYSAEDVRINLYGNAAVVAFRLAAVTRASDGNESVMKFHNTGTFVKRRGEWRAVAWQATRIPDGDR